MVVAAVVGEEEDEDEDCCSAWQRCSGTMSGVVVFRKWAGR